MHIVIGEIENVVAAMRLNSRWGSGPRLVSQPESPLLQGFKTLRATLSTTHDLAALEPLAYLKPFLGVIRSEETSGPITGVALSSVNKFLSYGFIHEGTPSAAKAMSTITDIVTHCRFEATAPDSDEVVLATILDVLLMCLKCPAGFLLSDDMVMEMIQTCFRMSVQTRMSELLRKRAERTLVEMVHTVFLNSASYFTPTSRPPEAVLPSPDQGPARPSASPSAGAPDGSTGESPEDAGEGGKEYINPRGVRFRPTASGEESGKSQVPTHKPYGVPCMVKLFGFICSLIQPTRANSEPIRLLGLSLVNIILETQPPEALFPGLLPTIQDELCRHLMLNLMTSDLTIFTLTLRTFYHLFVSYKASLKLQMEAFFLCLLNSVMESKASSYEKQELALECLVEFCAEPDFMIDLFLNYDCDLQCANLFEQLCKFLYKNSFPVSGALYTIHVLSLEGLLALMHALADRCKPSHHHPHHHPALPSQPPISAEELAKRKQIKRLLLMSVEHWNPPATDAAHTPRAKEAIPFLQEYHLLPDPLDEQSMALYLRNTPGLDKASVGQYLGKENEFNQRVLKSYAGLFELHGTPFIFALRSFLETFRLPGEAQQISRILECFAGQYFECNPNFLVNPDACFLLAFSTVLLNVDLHNTSVREKMTQEQFIFSLRGTNGEGDPPREALVEVYNSIQAKELKLLKVYTGSRPVSQHKWYSLLKRSSLAHPFLSTSSGAYDKEIFSVILNCPIIAAISVVFDTSYEDHIVQKALGGFNLCALISAHYGLSDVFDNLVISLCKFSTLLSPPGEKPVVAFGRNKKAQLATKTVFAIAQQHANHFREAWKYILNCVLSLQKLELLPALADMHQQVAGEQPSPSPAARRQKQKPSSGLLSSFTSVWFSDNTPDEPSAEDLEAEKETVQCINQCNLRAIILDTKNLQADSLIYLLKALILASVRPKEKEAVPFDEKLAIFCLDLVTAITYLNQERIIFLWVLVYEHFAGLLGGATSATFLTERAVSNLLFLCQKLGGSDFGEQLIKSLQLLLKLNPAVTASLADLITTGTSRILHAHPRLLRSPVAWPTLLSLIRFSTDYPNSSIVAFKALNGLILADKALAPEQRLIITDNFFSVFNTIKAFARSKACPPSLAIEAMECLYSLFCRLPDVVELVPMATIHEESKHTGATPPPANEAEARALWGWSRYWVPALQDVGEICKEPRLEVRHYAIVILQRALLSPALARAPPQACFSCFHQVIFPLLKELLVPRPTARAEAAALEETRQRASALASKIFLQYMSNIMGSDGFEDLWMLLLDYTEQYMNTNSELLAEAVTESLKNTLLVMSASNVLQPSQGHGQQQQQEEGIWEKTWRKIDAFCPSVKHEFHTVLAKTNPPPDAAPASTASSSVGEVTATPQQSAEHPQQP